MESLGEMTKWMYTLGVLAGLFATSVWFNSEIDDAPPPNELPDGQTAWWVVAGVLYTLAGLLIILTVWRGFEDALLTAGIVFTCFVASGGWMVWGDMRRTSARRKHNDSDPLAKAQRTIKNLRGGYDA